MILTIIMVVAFTFFGLAVLTTRNKILNGLKEGLKIKKLKEKDSENECCGGNCHCDEK